MNKDDEKFRYPPVSFRISDRVRKALNEKRQKYKSWNLLFEDLINEHARRNNTDGN